MKFNLTKFVFKFYTIYLVLALIGKLFIDYNKISWFVIFIYFIYLFFLILGLQLGSKIPKLILKSKVIIRRIEFFTLLLVLFSFFLAVYKFSAIVEYAGGIKQVFGKADIIRWKFINGEISLFPSVMGYLTGLEHYNFALVLVLYKLKDRNIYLYLSIFSFATTILSSFVMFGRVGILFNIFLLVAFFVINNIKLITGRNIFLFLILNFILNLPRLIRGTYDNFATTLNKIPFKIDIPSFLNIILLVFVYYFSSIYALDIYLKSEHDCSWGQQLFQPLFNIIARLFGMERGSLYEPFAEIPFKYNIYTIIKYIINDYSYFGLVIVPILMGTVIGYVFKYSSLEFIILQMFMIVFIFFSPLYNIYSFGTYFSALIIAFIFALFTKIK